MGNYHVRFWNGGGAVARSTDRSAADLPYDARLTVTVCSQSFWANRPVLRKPASG